MNTYIRVNGKVRYFKNEKEASAFLNGKKPAGGKKPADGKNNDQQDNE